MGQYSQGSGRKPKKPAKGEYGTATPSLPQVSRLRRRVMATRAGSLDAAQARFAMYFRSTVDG